MLGSALFNIFVNYMGDRTECSLGKFVADAKLGRVVGIPEGCAAVHRDLDGLEQWDYRYFMVSSKGNCEVLPLRGITPPTRTLGLVWLESSSIEEDLGVLVDTKLSRSYQCMLVAKVANSITGCIRRNAASRPRETVLPSAPHW